MNIIIFFAQQIIHERERDSVCLYSSSCLVIVRKLPTITLICSREKKRVRHLSISFVKGACVIQPSFASPCAHQQQKKKDSTTKDDDDEYRTDGPLLLYNVI